MTATEIVVLPMRALLPCHLPHVLQLDAAALPSSKRVEPLDCGTSRLDSNEHEDPCPQNHGLVVEKIGGYSAHSQANSEP